MKMYLLIKIMKVSTFFISFQLSGFQCEEQIDTPLVKQNITSENYPIGALIIILNSCFCRKLSFKIKEILFFFGININALALFFCLFGIILMSISEKICCNRQNFEKLMHFLSLGKLAQRTKLVHENWKNL